jgi:hypothetical protein
VHSNAFGCRSGRAECVREDISDWTSFISFVLSATSDERVAAQHRLARLLQGPQLGFDLGSELFAKGKSLDRSRYAPLANELMAAGGRSQGKLTRRQRRAVDQRSSSPISMLVALFSVSVVMNHRSLSCGPLLTICIASTEIWARHSRW